jgi:hypothetical protein
MLPATVVLLGDLAVDMRVLARAAETFGWSVERAPSTYDLPAISANGLPVIVLFGIDGPAYSWREMLKRIRSAAPDAFPIVCHGAEMIPWPQMADAGAFHAIRLPLKDGEAHQSLGFAWAALQHGSGNVFPIRRPAASRTEAVGSKVRSSGSSG